MSNERMFYQETNAHATSRKIEQKEEDLIAAMDYVPIIAITKPLKLVDQPIFRFKVGRDGVD